MLAGLFWNLQANAVGLKVFQHLYCSLADQFKAFCFNGMKWIALKASLHWRLTTFLTLTLLIILSVASLLVVVLMPSALKVFDRRSLTTF